MKKVLLSLGACALIGMSATTFAATASTTFLVTATVNNECQITATNMVFGTYSAFSATPNDKQSAVTVTCTPLAPYTIAANTGANSGVFTTRKMKNTASADTLDYNLYTTTARTTIWGDGTASTVTFAGTGTGVAQSFDVFGRIPIGQSGVPAGSYEDAVDTTVTF